MSSEPRKNLAAVRGFLAGAALLAIGGARAAVAPDVEVLVVSFLRIQATDRVVSESAALQEGLKPEDAAQVEEAMIAWQEARGGVVRDALQRQFGSGAEAQFAKFIDDFVVAAKAGDQGPLGRLCAALAIDPPCADYAELNRVVTEKYISGDVTDASWLLGNIQRWAELRRGGRAMPPLAMWLTRDLPSAAPAPGAVQKPAEPLTGAAALRAAEAPVQITLPDAASGEAGASPLAALQDAWKKKREQTYKDAVTATDQMLTQRKEWEEEYAAQRKAKAEADAEAFKKHCEDLAKAEKDALEQQQNSWQAKVKGIVGSLISSSVGAFTGGVGTQAGEKMAEKVFRKN